ncbi:TPA: 50S ribosomal protein L17 [Candidatus Saccharibacteria bacterium]|nr:50S ribosomal protein L17 [Candidatus Saccharibacteria bacterium]HIO87373.1 50S ribosomal protein L17 [Candidatus Saccharibacteria bacterium]
MHRHGYKGRKLGRKRDERRNLIKGLATSLIMDEEITTTLPKAKEVLPYTEKLVTRAKNATLADKRIVFSKLMTKDSAHKLIDEMAPKLQGRTSGHIRLTKTGFRKGDLAPMATLSFVDNLDVETVSPAKKAAKKPTTTKADTPKESTKKAPAKKPEKESK